MKDESPNGIYVNESDFKGVGLVVYCYCLHSNLNSKGTQTSDSCFFNTCFLLSELEVNMNSQGK